MQLYVGTSGYSYKEWKGTFYPKTYAKQMLHFYGEHFRTVEINNTFYRMPKASVLEGWAEAVPADFRFVLKASKRITHVQRLKESAGSVSYLLEVAGTSRSVLGRCSSTGADHEKGRAAAAGVSGVVAYGMPGGAEFRHASWFDDEVFGLLREPGRQCALPTRMTSWWFRPWRPPIGAICVCDAPITTSRP